MKDKNTGKRILVEMDPEHGPFISLTDYEQFENLDDELSEKHYVLFDLKTWSSPDTEESLHQMYFGIVADPEKVQSLIDEIEI